jgi:hypothetical protein
MIIQKQKSHNPDSVSNTRTIITVYLDENGRNQCTIYQEWNWPEIEHSATISQTCTNGSPLWAMIQARDLIIDSFGNMCHKVAVVEVYKEAMLALRDYYRLDGGKKA